MPPSANMTIPTHHPLENACSGFYEFSNLPTARAVSYIPPPTLWGIPLNYRDYRIIRLYRLGVYLDLFGLAVGSSANFNTASYRVLYELTLGLVGYIDHIGSQANLEILSYLVLCELPFEPWRIWVTGIVRNVFQAQLSTYLMYTMVISPNYWRYFMKSLKNFVRALVEM